MYGNRDAYIIFKLEPKLYRIYLWKNKHDKLILGVKLKKALYGTLQALLFWRRLSNTLNEWGFKLNEYDQCYAKKTVNCKQFTMIWHVEDLKVSLIDKKFVEDIIRQIHEKFGKESPLTTTQGKVIEHWGMILEYTTGRKVKILIHENA